MRLIITDIGPRPGRKVDSMVLLVLPETAPRIGACPPAHDRPDSTLHHGWQRPPYGCKRAHVLQKSDSRGLVYRTSISGVSTR